MLAEGPDVLAATWRSALVVPLRRQGLEERRGPRLRARVRVGLPQDVAQVGEAVLEVHPGRDAAPQRPVPVAVQDRPLHTALALRKQQRRPAAGVEGPAPEACHQQVPRRHRRARAQPEPGPLARSRPARARVNQCDVGQDGPRARFQQAA